MAAKTLWIVQFWAGPKDRREYKVMARSRRGALATVWPRFRPSAYASRAINARSEPTPSRQRFAGLGRKR